MQDSREPQKHRNKRKWVQVTPESIPLEAEPERVLGRDISENIKSTTPASSVRKTKTSAGDVPNTNTENSGTAPEVSERLTTLQTVFEAGQRETNARLDKLFSYVTREIQSRDATIHKLKEVEKRHLSLKEEHSSLEHDYHLLRDKEHTFKLISIISCSLSLITMALAIFVRCY